MLVLGRRRAAEVGEYAASLAAPTALVKPEVVTGIGDDLTATTATINGTVDPNSYGTFGYFQWGLTTAYGTTTTPVSVGAGTSPVAIDAALTGLTESTTYHFRAVGSNGVALVNGSDATFDTPSAAFDPSSITGMLAWYKADAIVGNDGDPVGTWADSSVNGADAVQAVAGSKPTLQTNEVNGLPVVRFDGTDDDLETAGNLAAAPKHVFVVAYYNLATFNEYDGLVTGHASDTAHWYLIGTDSATVFYDDPATTSYRKNGTGYAENNAQGPMQAWAYMSKSAASGWAQSRLRLGFEPGGAARHWNGDIAEVLVYDSVLSSGDRDLVEGYLATKYGL